VEVAVAGGGTDVLEGDVEPTDIFDKGLLEAPAVAPVDGDDVPGCDEDLTDDSRPAERADVLPAPRDEKEFPMVQGDKDDPAPPVPPPPVEVSSEAQAPPKARDKQALASKLTMLLVAVVALAGLVSLGVAITREVNSANASDDMGDLDAGYTCDRVSGSDPGVYGVGNCTAAGGMQASGVIPVGQAYLLVPRKANALGYIQSFSCSGGRAGSPSMVVPKRCAAIGNPVLASR
jgi:hypothetical protein